MKKVFIATTSYGKYSEEPIFLLKENDLEISFNKKNRKLTNIEVKELSSDYIGIIAGNELYSKETLSKLSNLKVISRLGVGLDNIEMDFAEKSNIKVYKTNTTPAPAVAELVVGLMIDLNRKISFQYGEMKRGKWDKLFGSIISGKTLGIIGLGTIGKKLVELTKGFNFTYLAYDIYHDKVFSKKNNIIYCDLDNLLQKSDIVSIHLNLTSSTRELIDYDKLLKMRSNAIIINTSRGEIINEVDLNNALSNGLIAGAGLDVFLDEPYNGNLLLHNNVITTPHIGSYAKEIRVKMEIDAARNLIKGLKYE